MLTKNANTVRPMNIVKVIAAAIATFSGFWYMHIPAIKYDEKSVNIPRTM